jgi:hypothetical protein
MAEKKPHKSKPAVHKTEKKSGKERTKPISISKDDVVRWQAPDYYTFERSPFWSFGVGILAIGLALILIYTENYFPVIIIILAVIVTFQLAHEKPKAQEFAADPGGILARNEYHPYSELKSFWVARHGHKAILYFEPLSVLKAPIALPLGNAPVSQIRTFLLRFLPEHLERGEAMEDKLIRIFRL